MNPRLKVLISAFACRPGKGSEPEVGWRWAMGMAHYHDVTVLTQPKHREGIERALAELPPETPTPVFHYFDAGETMSQWRKRSGFIRLYYIWWQRAARNVVAELHAEIGFDLLHHVTFAGYRYSTAIWGHGVPCIWGPVGGMESIPILFLPWDNPQALAAEVARNLGNQLQSLPFHVLPRHAANSTVVLVSTRETQETFDALGLITTLMPTIGIDAAQISTRPVPVPQGPLQLLFVGRIISLKGIDLAIRSLAASGTDAQLTVIGTGSYLAQARRLTARLGLADRVFFKGSLPLAEVLQNYEKHHVFIFPSLHDSGGFAVLEAMARGLPVICFDCGGPALSVREGCGIRVPLKNRPKAVADLAAAIRVYQENRDRIVADGERARTAVATHYEWAHKCSELNSIYAQATTAPARQRAASPRRVSRHPSSGFVFTWRGILFSIVVLLGIAVLELEGIRRLNRAAHRIATKTLPGLASAAMANESRNNTFIKTLLLIERSHLEQDPGYFAELDHLSQQTGLAFQRYENTIHEQKDRENFQRLLQARSHYVEIRKQVQDDVAANRIAKARQRFEQALVPAFEIYAAAAQEITNYSVEAGKRDAEEILRLTTQTRIGLALLGISIFAAGFLLGLSKT